MVSFRKLATIVPFVAIVIPHISSAEDPKEPRRVTVEEIFKEREMLEFRYDAVRYRQRLWLERARISAEVSAVLPTWKRYLHIQLCPFDMCESVSLLAAANPEGKVKLLIMRGSIEHKRISFHSLKEVGIPFMGIGWRERMILFTIWYEPRFVF